MPLSAGRVLCGGPWGSGGCIGVVATAVAGCRSEVAALVDVGVGVSAVAGCAACLSPAGLGIGVALASPAGLGFGLALASGVGEGDFSCAAGVGAATGWTDAVMDELAAELGSLSPTLIPALASSCLNISSNFCWSSFDFEVQWCCKISRQSLSSFRFLSSD